VQAARGQGHSWFLLLFAADACVPATTYALSIGSAQRSGGAGGGSSVSGDSPLQGCETPTPLGTTEEVTQLLCAYCLSLGYPFINTPKKLKVRIFLKRDLQGDI